MIFKNQIDSPVQYSGRASKISPSGQGVQSSGNCHIEVAFPSFPLGEALPLTAANRQDCMEQPLDGKDTENRSGSPTRSPNHLLASTNASDSTCLMFQN